MTVTEDTLEQESAAEYPLDEAIAALEDVLERLRGAQGYTDGPLELKLRAAVARRAAVALEGLPLGLYQEALECDSEAAAREAAAEARGALEQAAAAVEAAQEAHDVTAEPELEAGRRAITARQRYEDAERALTQAQQDGVEPDARDELEEQLQRRQKGLEFFGGELVRAQQARQAAGEVLEQARAQRRQAEADLAAAEDAVEHPDPANLDNFTLVRALKSGWTSALRDNPSPRVLAVCRVIAEDICDEHGWYSELAEARIERRHGRKMIASIRAGHGITLGDERGTYNLCVIRPGDRVIACGNIAGTVAQAR